MNKEFLLELYSGEIPALLQAWAAKQLTQTLEKEIKITGIEGFTCKFFYSNRRLTLLLENLEPFTKAQNIEQRGPKVSASLPAIEAFAKAQGVSVPELEKREYKGEIHYFCLKIIAAQNIEALLSKIVEKVLTEFTWPKSMKWDETSVRWIRPLLNILAIYNQKIVPINFGNLKSNNQSCGHFFVAKDQFMVTDFADYQTKLERTVMFDQDKRKAFILSNAQTLAGQLNLSLIEDPKLIEEVCGLVELPNLLVGTIDQKFLSLPQEVLQCSIRTHQKYFCLKDKNENFANKFIVVANSLPENNETVIKGNERVLTARLNDAVFFYGEDRKVSLEDRYSSLEKITFHSKLGTLKQKADRVIQLALALNHALCLSINNELLIKACREAKSDLTCEMVREFPELQGIMGYYYALNEGHDPAVALAIKEQYLPRGPSDNIPIKPLSIIIALADKLDSLYGLWYAGEKPTGSKDSFGLRRLALGIVRILIENHLSLDITDFLEWAKGWYGAQGMETPPSLVPEIKEFIIERFINYLKADYDHNILSTLQNISDIYLAKQKLDALAKAYSDPLNLEGFNALKRVMRFKTDKMNEDEIDKQLFSETIEGEFYDYLSSQETFELADLLKLEKLINQYFDQVIINHENENIKANRHNFIAHLQKVISNYADFSVF